MSEQSIYQQMKALGVPMDSHESDLYVPVSKQTMEVVAAYRFKNIVTTFQSQTEPLKGQRWYCIPFAFDPFWETRDVTPVTSN